jgi:hypothetical protein
LHKPKDSAIGKAIKEDNSRKSLSRVSSRQGNHVDERGLDELHVEFERDFEIDALD